MSAAVEGAARGELVRDTGAAGGRYGRTDLGDATERRRFMVRAPEAVSSYPGKGP
jgi:hypothetical protein